MASKISFTRSEMNSKSSFNTPPEAYQDELREGEVKKPEHISWIKLWLKKLSVETGGIERVTDEDRAGEPSKVWNACTFW